MMIKRCPERVEVEADPIDIVGFPVVAKRLGKILRVSAFGGPASQTREEASLLSGARLADQIHEAELYEAGWIGIFRIPEDDLTVLSIASLIER